MQPPKATALEDNAALRQLTSKPAGARPDYRGRWCVVSRGHPGRPSPPYPRAALGQLNAAPWELPSLVGKGIAWTRTRNVQTIECILHSTWSAFTGCTTREPPIVLFLNLTPPYVGQTCLV
ncbi:UNVERIFIED_CONTAM: hypothetical protein FKN15_029531 [Acipenser sinensis]